MKLSGPVLITAVIKFRYANAKSIYSILIYNFIIRSLLSLTVGKQGCV